MLQVINSSPGDLAPVFDAMLEKAMRLCEAAFGYLATYDGERFHYVGGRGLPPAFANFLREPWEPGSAALRVVRGEAFVHIADLLEGEGTGQGATVRGAIIEMAGARTQLIASLRKDDALLGMFVIYRQEVRPFSDKQIALLQNFAAQAVIAIENARLITETREAFEQQTATAEVLGVINSSPGDLAPVFEAMLDKALRLCEVDIGTLWTFDGEMVHAAAIRGAPPRLTEFLRKGPHRPAKPQQRVLNGERVVQIADVTTTEAYRDGDPVPRAIADLGGVRTLLIVPLRKDDAVLGNFAIYRCEVRPFTEKQIALLENFAAQAVIAMENARDHRDLGGNQQLARRPCPGVRRNAGKGAQPLRYRAGKPGALRRRTFSRGCRPRIVRCLRRHAAAGIPSFRQPGNTAADRGQPFHAYPRSGGDRLLDHEKLG